MSRRVEVGGVCMDPRHLTVRRARRARPAQIGGMPPPGSPTHRGLFLGCGRQRIWMVRSTSASGRSADQMRPLAAFLVEMMQVGNPTPHGRVHHFLRSRFFSSAPLTAGFRTTGHLAIAQG